MRFVIPILFFTCCSFAQNDMARMKVLEFSKNNIGKKIERGECWDLANSALNYANAKWEAPFNFGTKIDYKRENLLPGYILQFSNVKFVFSNGSASFPKHTAII